MKSKLYVVILLLLTFFYAPIVTQAETDDNEYVVVEDEIVTEELIDYEVSIDNLDIEQVIENSYNVESSYPIKSGTYQTTKYSAGISGYKYSISFDWTANYNESMSGYEFDTISNPVLHTHINYLITIYAYSLNTYDITRNTYSLNSSRTSITFSNNYDFEYILLSDKDAIVHSKSCPHSNTYYLDNLL